MGAEACALELWPEDRGVHPADTLALAAGGEEGAPQAEHRLQTQGHPAVRARGILRRLLPFTGGEVREHVLAALQALEEWSRELWGGGSCWRSRTHPRRARKHHRRSRTHTGSKGGTRRRRQARGGMGEQPDSHTPQHRPPQHEDTGEEMERRGLHRLQVEVHVRENGRENMEANYHGEAEGATEEGLERAGTGQPTQPTQPWSPPPVDREWAARVAAFEGPVRRRGEAQRGEAAARRRSKQRRRLGWGQRTRRSRSGSRGETPSRRRNDRRGGGGHALLSLEAEDHRRRREHAGLD